MAENETDDNGRDDTGTATGAEDETRGRETGDYAEEMRSVTERAERLERELNETRAELTRARVARSVGLPDELADRLRGDTEDEITADAERLSELFKATAKSGPAKRADVGQGNRTETESDSNAAFRRLARAAR